MFSTLWDTETVADADVWADYGDHAEDTWSDEADADEQEDPWPQGDIFAEDAAMEGHLFGWDA
jgi:hypothetical protein